MSQNLPVGETLNEAFRYGYSRILTTIRFAWAPLLLCIALIIASIAIVFDFKTLNNIEDPSILFDPSNYMNLPPVLAGLLGVVVFVIIMVILAGVAASIYRLVALGEDEGGIFNIRFDGPSLRVFWAQIIMSILGNGVFFIALLIVCILQGVSPGAVLGGVVKFMLAVFASAQTGNPLDPALMTELSDDLVVLGLAGLLSIIPSIFLYIRLSPFVAGSAAENRLILLGSFDLTSGRFWSIFFVYFLLILFLMVIAVLYSILDGIFGMLGSLGGGGALAMIGVIFTVIQIGMVVFYQAFTLGVQLSIQAIIYRRLKTGS